MQKNVSCNQVRQDNIGKAKRLVFSDNFQFSIFILHRRYEKGEIISRTFSKRKENWNSEKKSRLIESLLINIPIPMIYMAERMDGKKEVIDGQQRLDAIFDFLNNRYPLMELTILKELNGKRFKDFEKDYTTLQRKLEEYPLSVLVIKKESPTYIGPEIFKRLNQ